ncbi:WD40-repeat-containing domain protein [Trametes elegans]|nr:WD40-repeat-containing domain protein [Trametes elegans]
MPPLPPPLHEVYSQQLFTAGHGYPLWDAEPEDKKYEIEVGTVGRIDSGKFWLLFNAMKPADDPYQKHGVPSHFELFAPQNTMPQGPWNRIKTNLLESNTVQKRDISASASVDSPDGLIFSARMGFKFTCSDNAGAFLMLEPPGMAYIFKNKRHIVRHMRDNFSHWVEFANTERGMMLKQEEIFFVHGVIKTTRWAAGAFHGNCKNKEGSVDINAVGAGGLAFSMAFNTEEATRREYNYGPTQPRVSFDTTSSHAIEAGTSESQAAVPSSPLPRCNQCIFINYYKAKRRWLFGMRHMEAAAGPHELPPGDRDNPGGNAPVTAGSGYSEGGFEEVPSEPPLWDPVNCLLDYILANSDANMAIASDTDLYAIFHGMEIPVDIPAALASLRPTVEIDEEGAGTVLVNYRVILDQYQDEPRPISPAPAGDTMQVEGGVTPGQAGSHSGPLPDLPGATQGEQLLQDPFTPDPAIQRGLPPPGEFTPVLGLEQAPAASSSQVQGDDDDDESGLTEEEARMRREQKQPDFEWRAAAAGHVGTVTAITYSNNCKLIASGSDDKSIIIWDASDQSIVRKWDAHTDVVWALAFSPDDKRLASAGADCKVMMWSVETDELLATMIGHEEVINSMAWSPDGKTLASGSDDSNIRIWDAETYEQLHLLEGHQAMVTFVKYSPDNRYLASGSADYTCRIWDVASGTLHKELQGHKGMVWDADFDAESRRIITCSDDASARIWNVETGEMLIRIHEHHGPVWNVLFTRDGSRVLTSSSDSTLKICDSYSGERRFALEGHEGSVHTSCFSRDEKYIASTSADNTVRLWRTSDGAHVATFNEHEDKVTLVAFSPDGETLASGADDGTIRIRLAKEWNPDRAEQEGKEDGDGDEDEGS